MRPHPAVRGARPLRFQCDVAPNRHDGRTAARFGWRAPRGTCVIRRRHETTDATPLLVVRAATHEPSGAGDVVSARVAVQDLSARRLVEHSA